MTASASPGASCCTLVGLNVCDVVVHTMRRVFTSNTVVSAVAIWYCVTCGTAYQPEYPPHHPGPNPGPTIGPGTIIGDTLTRLSTPRSRVIITASAPDCATAASIAASL